jgi:hypothetical protein
MDSKYVFENRFFVKQPNALQLQPGYERAGDIVWQVSYFVAVTALDRRQICRRNQVCSLYEAAVARP